MKPRGRIRTEDERRDILTALEAWISEGKTLREFCRQEGMPSWTTVYAWMADEPGYEERFTRARQLGAEAIAQECLTIADTTCLGVEQEYDEDGDLVREKRGDMLGHRKLQIETRLKLLAKWFPQKYGDKVTQQIEGSDGGPIKVDATVRFVRPGDAG